MKRANDIEEQAAQWLVQLDSTGSPEKWAALDAWLAASPRHRAAFLRLSVAWSRSDNLRRLRPLDGEVDPDLLSASARRQRERRAWLRPQWAGGLAAAAALAIVAIGTSVWTSSTPSAREIYSTQLSKPAEEFILQDGTSVVLNTDSEVRVQFTPTHREVKLVRGEALFKVAHNAERPFDVVAGNATVRAVGTAFSVRVRDRSYVDVMVTEGRVALNPPSSAMLVAGQAASLIGSRVQTWQVEGGEIERKLQWIDGQIAFTGESLNDAATEFNRYNRTRIVIADPEVGSKRIIGVFEALDPDEFAKALESWGIRARTSDTMFGPRTIRLEPKQASPPPSD
jgi:transmembrane sensor